MERKFEKKLKEWFNKKDKLPLLVFGARQVGKTYIINDFCSKCGKKYYSFNYILEKDKLSSFDINDDLSKAIVSFALTNDIDLDSKDIIIFFDEIQECENLIAALKYFHLNYPNLDIVCAGSLLGPKLKKLKKSFPVGYVEELNMYPMDFEEFLIATDNKRFISIINECFNKNEKMDLDIHNLLLELYHKYLIIGGMPKNVQNFLDNNQKIEKVDFSILDNILKEYRRDCAKYLDNDMDQIRTVRILENIIPQLAKDNPKFIYSKLDKKDNRKSSYINALDFIIASGIVLECNQVTTPMYPLSAYIDTEAYKLFLNDVGLLIEQAGINKGIVLDDIDYNFKGRITENYVAQTFKANNIKLFYYSKKNENKHGMEINFLIQSNNDVIPVEVKASNNIQARSLQIYMNEKNVKYAIRISTKNFGMENNIKSVPLYAVFCIKDNEKIL